MNTTTSTHSGFDNEKSANAVAVKTVWVFYLGGGLGTLALDFTGLGAAPSGALYTIIAILLIPNIICTYLYKRYEGAWIKHVLLLTLMLPIFALLIITDRTPFIAVTWVAPLFLCILYNNQPLIIFYAILVNVLNFTAIALVRPFGLSLGDVQGAFLGLLVVSAVAIVVNRKDIQKARLAATQHADMRSVSTTTATNVQQSGQVIAQQTGNISASIEEISSTANSLAGNLQSLNAHVDQISEFSEDVSQRVEKGQERLDSLSKSTTEINRVMDGIQDKMSELMEQSEGIGGLVLKIKDIAFQTNLLALNASIEAARAGKAGRGFAVVAQEVTRLSNQTSQFVDEIESMVEQTNQTSAQARDSVESGIETIKNDTGMINEMGDALKSVFPMVRNIAANTREIAASLQDISAGGENLAATVEEQTATTAELSARAQELFEEASSLERELGNNQHWMEAA